MYILSPAVCTGYAGYKPTDADLADLFPQRDSSLFILGVVWASKPNHFTLIRAEREQLELPWKTEFWDPLKQSAKSSRDAGQAVLRNLGILPPETELPVPGAGPQTDGWSCGLHCLAKMEAWIRERRGERPGAAVPIEEVQARLNQFLSKLRAAKDPGAQSSGSAAGPATGGSGAAAAASGPAKASGPAIEGSGAATAASGPAKASRRAKAVPVEHASFDIALEAGINCKKCRVTKLNTKGCFTCMGDWFSEIQQNCPSEGVKSLAKRWAKDEAP